MIYYISQGRVETPVRRGRQFCCSFVANWLQYLYAKNYQNTMRFDKVIAKIDLRVQFFCLTVYNVQDTKFRKVCSWSYTEVTKNH